MFGSNFDLLGLLGSVWLIFVCNVHLCKHAYFVHECIHTHHRYYLNFHQQVCVYDTFLQAKAFESLCTKEMSQRKEMEEALARVRQEIDGLKDERNGFIQQLQMAQDNKLALGSQLGDSQCMVKQLEEKILSAVELLITFKDRRDKLQIEHRDAIKKVKWLRTSIKGEAASFCRAEFPVFSFMEINEATHNFDPSWKIGEGRYGSVYKGILRHMHVAIKMLPSYGSKTQLDFQDEVNLMLLFFFSLQYYVIRNQ